MTMPAGKYYVGDLCYVLHDYWDEFCDITIGDDDDGHFIHNGEFQFYDGRRFASFTTKWGDGSYMDQYGRDYCVDAGLIGCILASEIDEQLRAMAVDVGPRFGGQIITFDEPFECFEEDGRIYIGHVVVNTDPLEEDHDDEEYEDEEEDY